MMLTIAAPSSTSCMRSRYWRRNAFQPGSFGLLGELVRPVASTPGDDLGRTEPYGGVDVELARTPPRPKARGNPSTIGAPSLWLPRGGAYDAGKVDLVSRD